MGPNSRSLQPRDDEGHPSPHSLECYKSNFVLRESRQNNNEANRETSSERLQPRPSRFFGSSHQAVFALRMRCRSFGDDSPPPSARYSNSHHQKPSRARSQPESLNRAALVTPAREGCFPADNTRNLSAKTPKLLFEGLPAMSSPPPVGQSADDEEERVSSPDSYPSDVLLPFL